VGRRPPLAGSSARPRLGALLATLLLALPSAAQVVSQEKGGQLIRQCLEALGGQTFLKMRDKVQRGRAYQFYRDRLRGLAVVTIYTRYDFKPSSPEPDWIGVRERREFGKDGDYAALFADGKGFEITFRGARPFPADYMQRYHDSLRRDIFYLLKYRFEEPGMIFESLGTEVIDNQPADAVRITDADNRSVTVYLLKSNHLPLRQEYTRRDPKTREVFREISHYSKYRTVAGVRLPWNTLLVRDDEKIFESFGETVEINTGIEESVFALKKGTKVLPEEK
jgi:hypothetical protein